MLRYHYEYRMVLGAIDPEMLFILKVVKNRHHAIDIGANVGIYTRYLSNHFKSVDAFEPIKEVNQYIKRLNRKNISLHEVALSDTESEDALKIPIKNGVSRFGNASIETNEIEYYDHYESQIVIKKKLDFFEFDRVNFIKIDVEGHEMNVLKGAEQTIRNSKPVMLIEIEERHLHSSMSIFDIFRYIEKQGYTGFFLRKNGLIPVKKFDVYKYQKRYVSNGRIKLKSEKFKREAYKNNFFFLPIA